MRRNLPLLAGVMALTIVIATESVSATCFRFVVFSAVDSTVIPGATVTIQPGMAGGATDVSGRLLLCPAGAASLSYTVSSIGYEPVSDTLAQTGRQDTNLVRVFLLSAVDSGDSVTIFGERMHRRDAWVGQLTGRDVEVHRDASVAGTLDALPGFSVQSAGPNTGQIVARGFSGDRVTLTLDGVSSPDASTTAADHAVTISPALARKISILYGPEAFLYGSTPVGGVVDVETGFDGNNQTLSGFGTFRYGTGGSVADFSGVLKWQPVNSSELGVYSVYRTNGDLFLSDGSDLPGSDGTVLQLGGSAAVDFERSSGSGSYDYYGSEYGIPPDPTGAHADGVRIDMRKHSSRAALDLQIDSGRTATTIALDVVTSDYLHREFESDGIVGVEYGIAQTAGTITVRRNSTSAASDQSVLRSGYSYSHVAANGLRLSPTSRHGLHATAYHSVDVGNYSVNGSLRYDWIRSIEQGRDEPTARDHNGLSGGLGLIADVSDHLSAGVSVISTFRPPDIRELFSRGPHAANRSFEVGSPDLQSERGYGVDLFIHLSSSDFDAEVRFFGISFSRFLMPEATGDTDRVTSLPVYRITDNGARMYGVEIDTEIPIGSIMKIHASGDYVFGAVTDESAPLPRIPPATVRIALQRESEHFLAAVTATARAPQNRTGQFEAPTSGSILAGCNLQYRTFVGITVHTLTFNAENLMQSLWYDHLSRIREVYPGSGRAVSLSYRIDF